MSERAFDSVVEGIVIAGLSSESQQPANIANLALGNLIQSTNLSQQNTVSNQQSVNEIGVAVTGRVTNTLSTMGPLEAMSAVNIFTNNALASDIADLKATVNAFTDPGSNGHHHKKHRHGKHHDSSKNHPITNSPVFIEPTSGNKIQVKEVTTDSDGENKVISTTTFGVQ